MDEDSILSVPYNSPQALKPIYRNQSSGLNLPHETVYVTPQYDPECGLYVIFWDQVLECFKDAILCMRNGRHVYYVKDINKINYFPLRINTYLGIVLEVIVENPIYTNTETESQPSTLYNPFLYSGLDINPAYDDILESMDSTRGVGLTLKKAKSGNPQSQSDMGSVCSSYLTNYTKAMEWYMKAASQDDLYAQYSIGAIYLKGLGYPKDHVQANKWFMISAEKNYPQSLNGMGVLYFQGSVYPKDLKAALDLFTKADKLGCLNAPRNMALVYISGYRDPGSPSDVSSQIMDLYLRSAKRGSLLAQKDIAHMYTYGIRVPKSIAKAEQWCLFSAHQGYEDSQVELGRIYRTQENPEAFKWYRIAANQGDSRAQYTLGHSFCNGVGVPIDYVMGLKWLRLATSGENPQGLMSILGIYEQIDKVDDGLRMAKDLCPITVGRLMQAKRYRRHLQHQEKKRLIF